MPRALGRLNSAADENYNERRLGEQKVKVRRETRGEGGRNFPVSFLACHSLAFLYVPSNHLIYRAALNWEQIQM